VISGGEPTLWELELPELIAFFRRFGFAVKLDTNGSRPDILAKILPHLDYVAMDIKCEPEQYPELVGFHDWGKIEESIELIKNSDVEHEFRTTIIEDVHSHDHAHAIRPLIKGAKRYILQPFQPQEHLPDKKLRTVARTKPSHLRKLRDLLHGSAHEVIARGA
jgi:pyruvate formate lyase activating enzyme